MTHDAAHIDDEILSAFVDDQLTPDEKAQVQAHLDACSACQQRLEELLAVATLLRRLPDVDLPRDFSLGPRRVADPPNVTRLRRWYTVTRVGAATLAAAWLFLSAGALYVDSRPAPAVVELAQPRAASAPAPTVQSVPATPTTAARSAAAGNAAAPARPVSNASQANPRSDDQVEAVTSVNSLPTQVPTPSPTALPRVVVVAPVSVTLGDPAAPLRLAATIAGVVAVLTLLATLIVRRRLRQAASHL